MSAAEDPPKKADKPDTSAKAEKTEKTGKVAKLDADDVAPAKSGVLPPLPTLDERPRKLVELAPYADRFALADLVAGLGDGRGVVRANSALALAAGGHTTVELVLLLRDSEPRVALAAAEAFAHLGARARDHLPQLVAALDGASPEVLDHAVGTLATLLVTCADELIAALDVPLPLAMKTVIDACARTTPPAAGVTFLVKAAGHERSRNRVNAIAGLGRLGKADAARALALLAQIEATDPVPDIRTAAKQASLAVVAREKVAAVDALPKGIPDFEARKLSASELGEYADAIVVDEMIFALQDGRAHVKTNAARALGVLGAKAGPAAASALGLLARDSVAAVRREIAKALGKLGDTGAVAAGDLVGALGDQDGDVVDAATETLEALGDRATDALVRGLDAGEEQHGIRVGLILAKLHAAPGLLVDAFKSPAVNVQVNAALAMGALGGRLGAGLAVLHGARTGGDARTRDAVRRALAVIEAKGDGGPRAVAVDGFEDRVLPATAFDAHKAELEKLGAADLAAHLQDGREVVRANAASALGAIAAGSASSALGVRLRDDAASVRAAAAAALDRIGDAAVVAQADDLVGALRDGVAANAEALAKILGRRGARVLAALVRGLETDDPTHAQRICQVIDALPDASDILCDAFESPAVNVQVNAALGLGMLGKARVGARGRKALEGARTGGDARTREAVRKAIDTLDGPRDTGPRAIEVAGFEDKLLDAAAFDKAKPDAATLAPYLQDGRAVVRANAATGLGAHGAAAAPLAGSLGVLLRDDDPRVRIAAASAIDKLGDDAVRAVGADLVGALRGDAEVAKTVGGVLGARKAKVLTALLKGLETDDETHARRVLEVLNVLGDACEILCDAFDSPAENVQVNAAMGIGMLGAKRAGNDGRKKLEGARTGGFAGTRAAVQKALAVLKEG